MCVDKTNGRVGTLVCAGDEVQFLFPEDSLSVRGVTGNFISADCQSRFLFFAKELEMFFLAGYLVLNNAEQLIY